MTDLIKPLLVACLGLILASSAVCLAEDLSDDDVLKKLASQLPEGVKVLNLQKKAAKQAFRAKLLSPKGHVHFIWVDAQSGQIKDK